MPRGDSVMLAARETHGAAVSSSVVAPLHVDQELSVLEASKLMGQRRVEALLVIERREPTSVPLGLVTARDIVTRVIAAGLDPAVVTVGDIAWPDVKSL